MRTNSKFIIEQFTIACEAANNSKFKTPNSKLLHAPYGFCLQRVFWPVVFGVSASQFLAHFKVCRLPEAFEVLRQLYRFESGRQQFHKQRLLSVVYAWRAFHSEAFL